MKLPGMLPEAITELYVHIVVSRDWPYVPPSPVRPEPPGSEPEPGRHRRCDGVTWKSKACRWVIDTLWRGLQWLHWRRHWDGRGHKEPRDTHTDCQQSQVCVHGVQQVTSDHAVTAGWPQRTQHQEPVGSGSQVGGLTLRRTCGLLTCI